MGLNSRLNAVNKVLDRGLTVSGLGPAVQVVWITLKCMSILKLK